jgi:hypothetical protein
VAFEDRAASTAQPIAMFLEAGRHAKFIADLFRAEAVRVAATGSRFRRIIIGIRRLRIFRPAGRGKDKER